MASKQKIMSNLESNQTKILISIPILLSYFDQNNPEFANYHAIMFGSFLKTFYTFSYITLYSGLILFTI